MYKLPITLSKTETILVYASKLFKFSNNMVEESGIQIEHFLSERNYCLQKLCYGLGHIYNDLCAAIWFSYTLLYFQIVLGIKPKLAGTLIMIGQVTDSLATTTAGWAIDKTDASQKWYLAGSLCVAVGFSLIFSWNPGTYDWLALLYYGGLVILFQLGWAIVQISHLAIIPIISRKTLHIADFTAIRYTASVCCNIFVYIITWIILQNGQAPQNIGPTDYQKFKDIIFSVTTVGIFCSFLYYYGIKTKYENISEENILEATEAMSLINAKCIFKSHIIYFVSIMYMSSRLYTILNLMYIPLYLEERSSGADDNNGIRRAIASVPLASFCASFLTAIAFKNRSESCDNNVVYFIGSIFSIIGSFWIGFSAVANSYEIYAIVCFTGIGSSATMISSLCVTANFIKTKKFKSASVYSMVTFTDKLVSGIVIVIIQHLQCQPKNLCPYFYKHVLGFVGGGAVTLGLTASLFFRYQNARLN